MTQMSKMRCFKAAESQGGGRSVDKFDFDQMTTWFLGTNFSLGY